MKTKVADNQQPIPTPNTVIRPKLSQLDVPAFNLEQCLRVPEAIIANYARRPTAPLKVAQAMNIQPKSSNFRMLTGAAIAYGLIKGGAQAPLIELLPLAVRILRPTRDGDDKVARREALLKPKVIGQFLQNYDGNLLPREDIAKNVLVEMGVPEERAGAVLESIVAGARQVGLVQVIKGKEYIYLERAADGDIPDVEGETLADEPEDGVESDLHPVMTVRNQVNSPFLGTITTTQPNTRVFVTHGKNHAFLEPLKKVIKLSKMEPVVSVERQTVSKPLPDKVISDMRLCGSAIIHVDAETTYLDSDNKEKIIINPNVLIEIGAAIALYGRRFILLVRKGVDLPSNLSGLYEVRYEGEVMDAETSFKLMEALSDVEGYAVPDRYKGDQQQ